MVNDLSSKISNDSLFERAWEDYIVSQERAIYLTYILKTTT